MTKESKKMTARTRTLMAFLAAGACLLLAAPSAFATKPALKLTATSQPTNFVAGAEPVPSTSLASPLPQFSVIATNTGLVSTSGSAPIVLTVTLPPELTASLTPTPPVATDPSINFNNAYEELVCTVSGQKVTCTDPHSLRPGQWVQMIVPVKVEEGASGTLTSQVSVEGGEAAEASASITTAVSEEPQLPSFNFLPGPSGFSLTTTAPDGQPATQAGSHPSQLTVDLGFPSRQILEGTSGAQLAPAVHPKDLRVTLPRGMVADPRATPVRCTEAQLNNELQGGCPVESQIGVIYVATTFGGYFPFESPLYNMVPPPGAAAEFGFNAVKVGIFVHLLGRVNSAGEYELGADTPNVLARSLSPILGAEVQLWGNPSDPSHDKLRGELCGGFGIECSIAVKRLDRPLLTMPSSCRPALSATASADSWEEPGKEVGAAAQLEDPASGAPTPTDGCNQLDFAPTIKAKPTTDLSDAPTGVEVDLHVPQTDKLEQLATANFKDVKVTFPPGMAVNPSSASGLGACTPAQIGLTSGVGHLPVRTDEAPANCPADAKIGSVEVLTPPLDHPVDGAIYVAQPFQNPFGSLLAVYLAVYDEETGVVAKLAGRVEADPQTGQLTTSFADNPELPIEDAIVRVFGGPRAALKTPLVCGTHQVTSDIVPWSTPEGATEHPSDSFQTSVAASGSGACPSSEAQAPNNPSFEAGTIAPAAGAYSPFVLKLSREDGTQRLTGIDATLPKGLLAKLAGTTYCSEAQINQAKSREAPRMGALEQQSPSCPSSSEVGSVVVGAGAGILPFYASGHAYLAGPYKGAPLSLVVITPAVAGPYDLGSVVVRSALYVNPETAEVHAVSDPLPSIREGIPLDVRSVALKLDRPQFTLNPTNCNPMAVLGSASTLAGQSAALRSPFQVGGCSSLGFRPKLAISLKGATKRTGHPALKAVVTYPQGAYANIASAQVTLPHSAFLDQAHIKTICTRVQFAANACPAGAIYGFARATTPLLDKPLEGPLYLRSSSHKLPDLVLDLHGQIDAVAVARVDTGKGNGIRTTFEAIPDAPLSKVVVEMKGGKKGLLINSENICKKPQKAVADFTAQNGKVLDTTPTIANGCKKKHKKRTSHGQKRKSNGR
jgi:hypothetical protein